MGNGYISSPGEEAIEEFLDEKGIAYKREVKIPKTLKGDYADYRVADFYLPRYKTYIEFFGKWDSEDGKSKYRKKKEIYYKNNIPCVYLYPDNLGILEIIFRRRLRDVLKTHPELKFQRFLFNLDLLIEKHLFSIIILVMLTYFIKDNIGRVISFLILIYYLYYTIKSTFLK